MPLFIRPPQRANVLHGLQKAHEAPVYVSQTDTSHANGDFPAIPTEDISLHADRFVRLHGLHRGAIFHAQVAAQDIWTGDPYRLIPVEAGEALQGSVGQKDATLCVENRNSNGQLIEEKLEGDGPVEKTTDLGQRIELPDPISDSICFNLFSIA
jgi:hypothetical protein